MSEPIKVVKRERGCVTLSDGRRVMYVARAWDLAEFDGYLWCILPSRGGYDTLRDALKAAGVTK